MLVKMTHTVLGSPDGFIVERYERGKYYNMADSLAAYFIRRRKAIRQPLVDGCDNPEFYNTFYEA